MNFAQKYISGLFYRFTITFNLSRFCCIFTVLFAGQAFESNGRVSVTVMDGEEMVGRMADQVLILMIILSICLIIFWGPVSYHDA